MVTTSLSANSNCEKQTTLGMVQVYTGNGKGKTTAALGLGLRAVGHGYRVYMIQFMKGNINYGELNAIRQIDGFEIVQCGRRDFVDRTNPNDIDIDLAQHALALSEKAIKSGDYDVVILDEVNVALDFNLIPLNKVIEIIDSKPPYVELVLTGRYAPKEIIERADLVTEMVEVKHPYGEKGITARRGIEY